MLLAKAMHETTMQALYARYNELLITDRSLRTWRDFDQELDASGLNCPLPILRAKKSLASLESGQVLRVVATEPRSS